MDYKREGTEAVRVTPAVAKKKMNNNTASVHICKNMTNREDVMSIQLFISRNIHNLSLSKATNEQPKIHNSFNCYSDTQSHTSAPNYEVLILTSETPTPCCPEGTPVWFSASERYSGNGKHAEEEENRTGSARLKPQQVRSQVARTIHIG